MAGLVSAANLGGIADARLGDEADAIGTNYEHRGSISHDIPPPDLHGHKTIYLDSSVTFEDYHYWANRSREFEKHIRTDNVGLRQIGNLLIGKKIKNSEPALDFTQEKSPGNGSSDNGSDENKEVNVPEKAVNAKDVRGDAGGGKYGVTEAEWETAQRATRTATWGEIHSLSLGFKGPADQ